MNKLLYSQQYKMIGIFDNIHKIFYDSSGKGNYLILMSLFGNELNILNYE